MSIECPTCHSSIAEGSKFCPECGTPLALRCPSCGAQHAPGQRFCAECGTPLTEGAGAAAAGAAAAPAPSSQQPVAPANAEMRLVSVLFVDLVGFTSLSESRDAADVRELTGRYFEVARTVVERYGGTIEKFIGDAVMAVWGVPVAREDDAERAVRAALDVVDAVGVFGAEVGAPELRARAGVVTGQVAARENPGEGLVVGDRVNTASRVQSAAQPGHVYVDEITRGATAAAIAYEDAGEHSVKGKAEPLRLWRAVRVVAAVGGSEREQGLVAPFVGRDADLRLLKELFHVALDRRSARLVTVFGEAGVGKSRLRREFFNYIDGLAEGILWHDGRCPSYGEGIAYWALAEMVRQRLGIPEDAPSQTATERLTAGLERWVTEAADRDFLAPRLGALLGQAEPGLARDELFAGWRLFLERLAEHQPVVLVFEDLQWAEQGLLDFIEQLLDWSASSPIFIVGLARNELNTRHPGWPAGHRGATVLQLDPLEEGAMRELLDGVVDLPAPAVERIVGRAEGIPLYAVETLRALLDRGVLAERDGRLVLEGELGELDVPASLGSLLAARLDALDPAERSLIKAMAVFGGTFPRSAAAALGGVEEEQLDETLAALVCKQVLVIRTDRLSPDRGQYAFAQGLLRTVAYNMLSRQERQARHVAAAEHLRRAFPGDGEEVAEVIAAQYLEAYRAGGEDPHAGELRAETLAALRRAAQRAAAIGAPEAAERSLRTAVELAADEDERADLVQLAGESAFAAGRNEAAAELLGAAVAAHRAAGRNREAARAAAQFSRSLTRGGHIEAAVAEARAALELLGSDAIDLEAGLLQLVLGRALVSQGRFAEGAAPLERALTVAEALGRPDLLAEALLGKGVMYLLMGRPEEARVVGSGAVEISRRHGLVDLTNRASGNVGVIAMEWDRPEATKLIEEAVASDRRRGNRYAVLINTGNLLVVHLYAGRWEVAERLAHEALGELDSDAHAEDIQQRLCILYALRGEVEAARERLQLVAPLEHSDEREAQGIYTAGRIAVEMAEGRLEQVVDRGDQVAAIIEDLTPSNESVRFGWPDVVQAALRLGRHDEARRLLALIGDRPAGLVPPYLRAQLARLRALLAAEERRHDQVEGDLRAAIASLTELAYPYWCAVAQSDLAQWLIEQGRREEAEGLLSDAVATLTSLRAAPALARAQGLQGAEAREVVA